jgi:hypothetical protein
MKPFLAAAALLAVCLAACGGSNQATAGTSASASPATSQAQSYLVETIPTAPVLAKHGFVLTPSSAQAGKDGVLTRSQVADLTTDLVGAGRIEDMIVANVQVSGTTRLCWVVGLLPTGKGNGPSSSDPPDNYDVLFFDAKTGLAVLEVRGYSKSLGQ